MYPTQLLVILILLSAGALAFHLRARAKRAAQLRALAGARRMQYSPQDRFGLAPRVGKLFPTPGVADVRVTDLLYHSDEAGHRYVFTVDYTRGILGAKRRLRATALLTEPRDAAPVLRLGVDDNRPISARYESLLAAT